MPGTLLDAGIQPQRKHFTVEGKGRWISEGVIYQVEVSPRENRAWEEEGGPGRCFGKRETL